MALACLRKASQSRTAACQVSAAPAWRAVQAVCTGTHAGDATIIGGDDAGAVLRGVSLPRRGSCLVRLIGVTCACSSTGCIRETSLLPYAR